MDGAVLEGDVYGDASCKGNDRRARIILATSRDKACGRGNHSCEMGVIGGG